MAAVMLSARLDRLGVEHVVESAGFATNDRPATFTAIEVLSDRGIDLSEHRSRLVGAVDLERPDLIIGMERRHVRELAVAAPVFERSFTLPDLARRAAAHHPRQDRESVREWAARLGRGRRPADLLGSDEDDEVEDPYGRPSNIYRRTADEIEQLLDVVVSRMFP